VPSDDTRAQQVAELIKKCLQPDPKKRLMPEEALRHTFFKKLDLRRHSNRSNQVHIGAAKISADELESTKSLALSFLVIVGDTIVSEEEIILPKEKNSSVLIYVDDIHQHFLDQENQFVLSPHFLN